MFQPKLLSCEELQQGVNHAWDRTYALSSIVKRLWGPPYLLKPIALLSNLNFRRFMQRVHFHL